MKAIQVTGRAGKAYGHVPGHQYKDVDVTIRRTRNGRWSIEVLETWGSSQGYDEEHGRKKVIGRGDDLSEAVRDARQRAQSAGIGPNYVEEAISEAEDMAETEAERADSTLLADVSSEELLAEIARRRGLTLGGCLTPAEAKEYLAQEKA